ncbi:uncharacterized protein LOC114532954 [Dendronephthya gigantea]|uniref:uncharacterized protein LOC114532954 n=1 Tax=Dendronephthya gigantea TaxID=151771 RepID=UPI0010698AE9|nr:uncharacterized protein LOC114532954 [Dendronephthya gigantea]
MASTKTKLTKEQVSQAVKILGEWFPEENENFKKHHDDIVRHILEGTEPKEGAPLLLQVHAKKAAAVATELSAEDVSLTPCQEAIGVFIADVVFFILGLVGLHASNQERVARALIRELGGTTLNGFLRAIEAFNEAKSATAKAKALFTIFSQVYKAGGFKAVFKVLKDEMSWWDWTKTGIIAVAQITAWFATDGVAFIAEVALNIMSATQMIEDGIKAAKTCKGS